MSIYGTKTYIPKSVIQAAGKKHVPRKTENEMIRTSLKKGKIRKK